MTRRTRRYAVSGALALSLLIALCSSFPAEAGVAESANPAAPASDAESLSDLLNKVGAPFGTRARVNKDKSIMLEWR